MNSKVINILIILLLVVPLVSAAACQSGDDETRVSIPLGDSSPTVADPAVGEGEPDDLLPVSCGPAYRANVHQQGVENPWPPIETVEVRMKSGSETIHVRYRNNIVTEAGETRNNIFTVRREGGFVEYGRPIDYFLRLYATSVPTGLHLFQDVGGGLIGTLVSTLVVEVSEDMQPGIYTLEIGIEIVKRDWRGRVPRITDEKDYGTVPCTIEVIEPAT